MNKERIFLINALSKHITFELSDQIQHYKDIFQINNQLELIDSEIISKKFFNIINDHLVIRKKILDKDSAWNDIKD